MILLVLWASDLILPTSTQWLKTAVLLVSALVSGVWLVERATQAILA